MPVYSSHLLRDDELQVGGRIREARQQQGVTLRQLAARLDTSSARLSQIENGRLRLDLHEVLAVAEALDIALDGLVPPDAALPYQIRRDIEVRAQRPRPILLASGGTRREIESPHAYWPLADLFVGRHLEPVLGRIAPLAGDDLRFCYHDEEEFVSVVRGTIEFRIKTPQEERREELHRGDCVYFRSDLPHCFRSLESDAAETLHVFCSPSASAGTGFERSTFRAIAHDGNGAGNPRRHIGERLRLLRDIHGWSLERVADLAGLSERQLQRIERGDRAISLESMLRLARAVGKPLRELIGLSRAREPYYVIQRSDGIPSLPSRKRRTPVERPSAPASKTCQPLVPGFPARDMYPYFLRMLNVELDTLRHHEHHGQEFIYVLEGELELMTYSRGQEVREVIRAGDACYIDSTVPHLIRSWTRNPYSETSAEVIDVFWCPLGESYLFDI